MSWQSAISNGAGGYYTMDNGQGNNFYQTYQTGGGNGPYGSSVVYNSYPSSASGSSSNNYGQFIDHGFYGQGITYTTNGNQGLSTTSNSNGNYGQVSSNGAVDSSTGNVQNSAVSSSSSSSSGNTDTLTNNDASTTGINRVSTSNGVDAVNGNSQKFSLTPIPSPKARSFSKKVTMITTSKESIAQLNGLTDAQQSLETDVSNAIQKVTEAQQSAQNQINNWFVNDQGLSGSFNQAYSMVKSVADQAQVVTNGARDLIQAMTVADGIYLEPAWLNLVSTLQTKARNMLVNVQQSTALLIKIVSQFTYHIELFQKSYDQQYEETTNQIQGALGSVADQIQSIGMALSKRTLKARDIAISWINESQGSNNAPRYNDIIHALFDPIILKLTNLNIDNFETIINEMLVTNPKVLSVLYDANVPATKIVEGNNDFMRDFKSILTDSSANTSVGGASGAPTSSSTAITTSSRIGGDNVGSKTVNGLSTSSSSTSSTRSSRSSSSNSIVSAAAA